MKKALLATVLCVPLSGCFQTTAGDVPPSVDPFAIWKQASALTSGICHFAPSFQTVADLLALGPGMESVNAVVQAVCGAITGVKAVPVRGKPGVTVMTAPRFRGVLITGQRV